MAQIKRNNHWRRLGVALGGSCGLLWLGLTASFTPIALPVPPAYAQSNEISQAYTLLGQGRVDAAIAAFERTLITPGAPFDRYLAGDTSALTAQQKEGLALFQSSGCIGCHNGVLLGGNGYAAFSHVEGRGDVGRMAVTGREEDRYVFRIAPLRNVAQTAPYFHDGSAATLHDAVSIMGSVQLERRFTQDEVDALVAYLHSLTGEFPQVTHPMLPRTVPPAERVSTGPESPDPAVDEAEAEAAD